LECSGRPCYPGRVVDPSNSPCTTDGASSKPRGGKLASGATCRVGFLLQSTHSRRVQRSLVTMVVRGGGETERARGSKKGRAAGGQKDVWAFPVERSRERMQRGVFRSFSFSFSQGVGSHFRRRLSVSSKIPSGMRKVRKIRFSAGGDAERDALTQVFQRKCEEGGVVAVTHAVRTREKRAGRRRCAGGPRTLRMQCSPVRGVSHV